MNHATVRLGDYKVPLIGIPESATEEECNGCKKRNKHLSEVMLDEQGRFMCWSCRMKERIKAKVIEL